MRQYLLHRGIGLLAIVFLALAGCGPRNAEEFRKNFIVSHDSFEVDRPYKDVAATLRQKAAECLEVEIKLICTNCVFGGNMGKRNWTPTLITNPERTELHLQFKRPDAIGQPPNGDYEIVLDAVPLDKKRTKIDIYRLRPQERFLQRTMAGWVRGEALDGCPDLSTIH